MKGNEQTKNRCWPNDEETKKDEQTMTHETKLSTV